MDLLINQDSRVVVIDIVLRKLLDKKNLKQCQVAEKVGLPASTFHDWTYGRVPRNLSAVYKIAKFLGVKFEYLIFGGVNEQEEHQQRIKQLEVENAMLKIQNESQLNLFESPEQAMERLRTFKAEIINKFPELEIGLTQ